MDNKIMRFKFSDKPDTVFVIANTESGFEFTTEENYNARIRDARKVQTFRKAEEFATKRHVLNAMMNYAPKGVTVQYL